MMRLLNEIAFRLGYVKKDITEGSDREKFIDKHIRDRKRRDYIYREVNSIINTMEKDYNSGILKLLYEEWPHLDWKFIKLLVVYVEDGNDPRKIIKMYEYLKNESSVLYTDVLEFQKYVIYAYMESFFKPIWVGRIN